MSRNNGNKRIFEIINAYLKGTATPEEYIFLNDYYECAIDEDAGDSEFTEEQWGEITKRIRDGVEIKLSKHYQKYDIKKFFLKYIWPIGLAALVLIVSCIWFGILTPVPNQNIVGFRTGRHPDQHNKVAIMTLGSGIIVTLDNKAHKEMPSLPGVKAFLPKADQLVFTGNVTNANISYTTVHAPKGTKFQLILPDGTLVCLNPGSVLKFPNLFAGNERRIELSGAAHFEVAANKRKPFKVFTSRKSFIVMKSHFNVDDSELKTTSL